MSLRKRFSAAAAAFRAGDEYWQTLIDALNGGATGLAGVNVSKDSAETYAAVWASLVLITETLSTVPLQIFRRTSDGRELHREHPLYKVLHDQANRTESAQKFRETFQWNMEMRGIGIAEKVRDRSGIVRQLWNISPEEIEAIIIDPQGMPQFKFSNGLTLGPDKIFYCYGPGAKGMTPRSRLRIAAESIGLGLAAEEYGARFFGQGTNSGGFLETDKALKKETFERLKQSVNEKYSGLGNAHKLIILEEGMKYARAGMANDDAQFLETRKFQVSEIARFFGLKPHMIGDLEHATFSNIEQQGIEAVRYSWRPRAIRLEQAINMQLLNEKDVYAEHNLDGLMQGDLKSQMEAWHIGLQDGVFNANEVREKLNLNSQAGDQGEIYYMPLNMQDKSKVGEPDPQPQRSAVFDSLKSTLRDHSTPDMFRSAAVAMLPELRGEFPDLDEAEYIRQVDKLQEFQAVRSEKGLDIDMEFVRMHNAYIYAAMQASGAKEVIWRSEPDCPHCQHLNGKRVAIGEPFEDGVRHAPLKSGCSCSIERG